MSCTHAQCMCGPSCDCGGSCPCHLASKLASEKPLPDFWVTREEVASLCPPCAARMASLRITRILASALFGQDLLVLAGATSKAWESSPPGWGEGSKKKLWDSLGGSVKDCMKKMKGRVDDSGSFCASLKDRVEHTTEWRGPEG